MSQNIQQARALWSKFKPLEFSHDGNIGALDLIQADTASRSILEKVFSEKTVSAEEFEQLRLSRQVVSTEKEEYFQLLFKILDLVIEQ